MGNVVGHFFTGTAIACVLKLTTSVDDLIWFSPFLALCTSNAERVKCSLIYVAVCLIVTLGAMLIAFLANLGFSAVLSAAGNDGSGYWDAARVLSLMASVAIGTFAAKEFKEWKAEDGNELPSWYQITHTLRALIAKGLSRLGMSAELIPTSVAGVTDDDEDVDRNGGSTSNNSSNGSGSNGNGSRQARRVTNHSNGRSKGEQGLELLSQGGEVTLAKDDDSSEQEIAAIDGDGNNRVVLPDSTSTSEVASAVNPMFEDVEVGGDERKEEGEDAALDSDEEEAQRNIEEARKSSARLFVVAFCGTLDDMAMFSAVILGKSIMMLSLLFGSMLATGIILVACWQISLYKPFADCIQKVPMWCLLGMLSLYILIGGLLT